jgi:hypothetical protein
VSRARHRKTPTGAGRAFSKKTTGAARARPARASGLAIGGATAPRLLRIPENDFPIIAVFDVMNCIEPYGNGTGSIYNSRHLSLGPE